ncbi:hypothetical protein BY458DRAFT_325437 [Sporodiniella umbellata]|nr:hypothetical protein BY458DRAFT_325437 [Sporodiniella umbellata]
MKRSKWQLLYLAFVVFFVTIANASIAERATNDKLHIKTVANCYRAKRTDRHHWKTISGRTKIVYVCRKNHHTTSTRYQKSKTKHHTKKHHHSVIHHHGKGHHSEKKHTTVHHHYTKTTKPTSRHRGSTGTHQSKKSKKGSKVHHTTSKKHKKTATRHNKHSTTVHHTKGIHHTKSTHTIINSHKTGETTSLTTSSVTSTHVTPGSITISLEGFEPALQTFASSIVPTTTGSTSQSSVSTNTQAYIPTQNTKGLSTATVSASESRHTATVAPNDPNNNNDNDMNNDKNKDDNGSGNRDNNDDDNNDQIEAFGNDDDNSSKDGALTAMGTTINPAAPVPTGLPNTQITAQKNSDGETVEATHQNKIIGISVGAVVGCVAAAGLAGMFIYRRRQDQETEEVPDEVNTRYRTQSFMAVVAGAVAKLPKRSDSSSSSGSGGVMGTLKRAATSMSRSLSRSGSRSSQQSYGIAVSGPMPGLTHADDRNYHTHAY